MAFVTRLWDGMNRHDTAGLAAEMAFHWVLSLVPTMVFLLALIGLFGTGSEFITQTMSHLHRLMPAQAHQLLQSSLDQLMQDSSESLAVVGLLGAFWTASNGAWTVEKALNRIYHLDRERQRNVWRQRGVSFFLVFGMAVVVLVCANLVVFGDVLYDVLERYFFWPLDWLRLIGILRWGVALGGLIAMSAFIYSVAPEAAGERRFRYVWPGAVVFVVLWILSSLLFNLYVSNFGNYSKVYGPMGALVVLMLWFYFTSFALLIGGEVNALLLHGGQSPKKAR
jgi:membrane protein